MAVYKVAQDVEAEDKLLGPFSFRQFIYLIIAVMAIVMAWGLSQLFLPLAILPLPVVILFGALALPLRKDQPMETYLGALISFFLKPRKRLWQPDGIESLIEITAPRSDDAQRTKDLSRNEAQRRLAYLADLADSRGWSIRHSAIPEATSASSMVGDVYNEAQQTEDILDDSGNVALAFENMIGQADERRRQAAIERMSTPVPAPQIEAPATISMPPPVTSTPPSEPSSTNSPAVDASPATPLHYDPYPNMHQAVINPSGTKPTEPVKPPVAPDVSNVDQPQPTEPQKTAASTSVSSPSADILNLANNTDLSIETIAHEAKRRSKKSDDNEVVISLR